MPLSPELVDKLHRLTRTQKLEVLKFLVNDLKLEELGFIPGVEYEVWSPQVSDDTIAILQKMLDEGKNKPE
jgi:hypothetical protein